MKLQKQVEITEDILDAIERATDTTVEAQDIVVFEAAALSTKPLDQKGTIFNGARPSRSMLEAMVEGIQSGDHRVPLHTMHRQSSELPVGRVFAARLVDETDGSTTLRAMFYLPKSEKDMVEKINLSILDEVSVGVQPKQGLCSECGFDYFGEDADFSNLFSQTCENGHTIGEEGTHLNLIGLSNWRELSLVSRGASNNPKILSRARSLMGDEEYNRLAASGTPPEALILFANSPMETSEMPDTDTENKTSEPSAELQELTEAINALTGRIDAVEARFAEAEEEAQEEAETEEEAELSDNTDEVADLTAQLAAAQAKILELTAEPEPEPEQSELSDIELPAGGVAASAISDTKDRPQSSVAAFKTKRS